MASVNTTTYGQFSVQDTGVPKSSIERELSYSTLVLLHGFAWHSGSFQRLLPLANEYNTRILIVNRRDYPGSTPFTHEERELLDSASADTPEASEKLQDYARNQGLDIFNMLVSYVGREKPSTESITLAGWSFGTIWALAFLAFAPTFPKNGLNAYVKRVILYDPPYHSLGYSPPPDSYNPLFDAYLAPEQRVTIFPVWVSSYYKHGESANALEYRTALADPKPTMLGMTSDDIEASLYPGPAQPDGSDSKLLEAGIKNDLFATLRKMALYPTLVSENAKDWSGVELRQFYCDQSVWETSWGTWALKQELEEAKKEGKKTRNVTFYRLSGANHFAHWDMPEKTLSALISV